MPVEWTTLARADLENILVYVADDDPRAAVRVIAAIRTAVRNQLPQSPFSGRIGRVKNTRELVVPRLPYIVAYRVTDTAVQILRVLHGRERWPENL